MSTMAMSIMKSLTPVMGRPIILVHTFRWGSDGIGIPFSIGVSHTAHGISLPIITLCLTTDIILGIPDIGEVTIQAIGGVTIPDIGEVTIRAMDIPLTGMGKPL